MTVLDFFGVFVGDLEVEGLFKLHDELNDVEGVGAEVLLKRCAWSDFGFIYLELFNDDLLYFFFYRCHAFLLNMSGDMFSGYVLRQSVCGGCLKSIITATVRRFDPLGVTFHEGKTTLTLAGPLHLQ